MGLHHFHIQDHFPAISSTFIQPNQLSIFMYIIISLHHLQSVHEVISKLYYSKIQSLPTIVHINMECNHHSFLMHYLACQYFHYTIIIYQYETNVSIAMATSTQCILSFTLEYHISMSCILPWWVGRSSHFLNTLSKPFQITCSIIWLPSSSTHTRD